jgi:TolB protein
MEISRRTPAAGGRIAPSGAAAVCAAAAAWRRRALALITVCQCLLFAPAVARAVLTIEITHGLDTGIPIAVVPFRWQGPTATPPQDISQIVAADLARTGRFRVFPRAELPAQPHEDREVVFQDWRAVKAEALVIGAVRAASQPGQYQVEFRLYDVFKGTQLAGYRYTVGAELLRKVSHQIADIIYEKLIGVPGAFNTRIAYVTKENGPRGAVYKLQVADSDGYDPKTIVASPEPLLSPAWSPDGKRIAYVSFEDKRAKVYIQDLSSGRREVVAEHRGINSAPAFSPDGRRLALTLSRDGNAEIYVLDLATRELKRLTYDPAIDTEPAWSPDGRFLVFTSDRAGQPQLYRMPAEGGPAERLTFEGDYNARASFSPDGRLLALVTRERGRFQIATLDLASRALQVLTDTPLDESPSFAPNGHLILYATEVRGRGVLASVSVDGRVRQLYRLEEGDVREPAWSPPNRELQN